MREEEVADLFQHGFKVFNILYLTRSPLGSLSVSYNYCSLSTLEAPHRHFSSIIVAIWKQHLRLEAFEMRFDKYVKV